MALLSITFPTCSPIRLSSTTTQAFLFFIPILCAAVSYISGLGFFSLTSSPARKQSSLATLPCPSSFSHTNSTLDLVAAEQIAVLTPRDWAWSRRRRTPGRGETVPLLEVDEERE